MDKEQKKMQMKGEKEESIWSLREKREKEMKKAFLKLEN